MKESRPKSSSSPGTGGTKIRRATRCLDCKALGRQPHPRRVWGARSCSRAPERSTEDGVPNPSCFGRRAAVPEPRSVRGCKLEAAGTD